MVNCELYKNGVRKALNAGVYNPTNFATCQIKRLGSSTKSHGLGKGGRRFTRRGRKPKRSTRRTL
jgi:hypothetical protein